MHFVSILTLIIVTVDSNNDIKQRANLVCNKPKNDGSIIDDESHLDVFSKKKLKNPELRFVCLQTSMSLCTL